MPPKESPIKWAFWMFAFSLTLSRSKTRSSKLKSLLCTGDFPWPLKSYVTTVNLSLSFGTMNLHASSAPPTP